MGGCEGGRESPCTFNLCKNRNIFQCFGFCLSSCRHFVDGLMTGRDKRPCRSLSPAANAAGQSASDSIAKPVSQWNQYLPKVQLGKWQLLQSWQSPPSPRPISSSFVKGTPAKICGRTTSKIVVGMTMLAPGTPRTAAPSR